MSEMIGKFFAAIALVIFMCVLLSVPIYFLWNWLCPELFNLPYITVWQALGLSVLSNMLFKSSSSNTNSK